MKIEIQNEFVKELVSTVGPVAATEQLIDLFKLSIESEIQGLAKQTKTSDAHYSENRQEGDL